MEAPTFVYTGPSRSASFGIANTQNVFKPEKEINAMPIFQPVE